MQQTCKSNESAVNTYEYEQKERSKRKTQIAPSDRPRVLSEELGELSISSLLF